MSLVLQEHALKPDAINFTSLIHQGPSRYPPEAHTGYASPEAASFTQRRAIGILSNVKQKMGIGKNIDGNERGEIRKRK